MEFTPKLKLRETDRKMNQDYFTFPYKGATFVPLYGDVIVILSRYKYMKDPKMWR